LENLKGIDHIEDLDVDGRTMLERMLGKQGGNVWIGLTWLRTGISVRLL